MKRKVIPAVFILFVFGLSFFIWKKQLLHIKQVSVKLNGSTQVFKTLEKNSLKRVQKFKGHFLYGLSMKEIDKELKKDPRVKRVSIYRHLPGQLEVEVTPHSPIALMLGLKQELYPLARDASLLPQMSASEALDLPVMRGLNFHKNKKLRKKLIAMLLELPSDGVLSKENISEVRYEKKKGFLVYLIKPELSIYFGEAPFKLKVSRVERVFNYMKTQQLQGRVIDARISEKVVVKMRNEL